MTSTGQDVAPSNRFARAQPRTLTGIAQHVGFGPGRVLFTSRWAINELGQTKPGSSAEDKVIHPGALGVASSHATVNFVPAGYGGAGQVKLVSYGGGEWFSATLAADGNGAYDLNGVARVDVDLASGGYSERPGWPRRLVCIGAANAGFGVDNLLISDTGLAAIARRMAKTRSLPRLAFPPAKVS